MNWLARILGFERLRKLLDDIACLLVDIRNIVQTRQFPMPPVPPVMVHAMMYGFSDNVYMTIGGSAKAGETIRLVPWQGMRKCILFIMTDLDRVAISAVYNGTNIPFAGPDACPVAFIPEVQLGTLVQVKTELRK